MAKATDLTVRILTEIRDEIRQTNVRLDQTNSRLDGTNVRLDKVEEALLELATQQRFIVKHSSPSTSATGDSILKSTMWIGA